MRSRDRVALNQWNTIRATRRGVQGELSLNGGGLVAGQSPGSLKQLNVDDVSYVGGMALGWRSM